MERRHIKWGAIAAAALSLAVYYFNAEKFTNPMTGEEARVGMSRDQEQALGLQGYQQVLSESQTVQSGPEYELVKRVADRLTAAVGDDGAGFEWAVSLVQSDEVNAFCLPGGKIVVYTGILPIAQTEDGLAVVMGHEIAHAIARHGAQRVFQQGAVEIAQQGLNNGLSDLPPGEREKVLGLLGAGAQYGLILPFSRDHELEADEMGLIYMARAGYDPEAAIGFWERMARAGGNKPPEFMSTHPSDSTRIRQIRELLPRAQAERRTAGE